MVITEDFAKKKIQRTDSGSYLGMMFLDIEHLKFNDDIMKFEWGIRVLNQINQIAWANEFCREIKSDQSFDSLILTEVINSIFHGTKFSTSQLMRYFELVQQFQKFNQAVCKLHAYDHNLSYKMECYLFGLPLKVLENEKELEKISGYYLEIYSEFVSENKPIKKFIELGKELISTYK